MTLWQTLFGLNGRIGRSTFWLLVIAVGLLDLAFASLVSDWIHAQYFNGAIPLRPDGHFVGAGFGVLVVAVLSLWILLSLGVKRAHDRGRSGWWLLIGLIPVYGVLRAIWDLGFQPGASRRSAHGDGLGSLSREPQADRQPLSILADAQAIELEPPTPEVVPDAALQSLEDQQSLPAEPVAELLCDDPGGEDELAESPAGDQPTAGQPLRPEPEGIVQAAEAGEGQDPVPAPPTRDPLAEGDAPQGRDPASDADEPTDSGEPQADPPAQWANPSMEWGRSYGADPSWSVFQQPAPTPASVIAPPPAPAASEPEGPAQTEHASGLEQPSAEAEWWEEMSLSTEIPAAAAEGPAPVAEEPALPAAEHAGIEEPHAEPAPGALIWKPAPAHEAYAELGSTSPRPANDPHPGDEDT